MADYKVPKERVCVTVLIPPRPPEPRCLFLSPHAQGHRGSETPADIFNAAEPFLPLFREDGAMELVRRDTIRWVKVENPLRCEWYYYQTAAGAPRATVRCELDGAGHLEGRISLAGPSGGRRVIDAVNRRDGFLHLESGEDLYLVNVRCVSAITVKEEGDGGA